MKARRILKALVNQAADLENLIWLTPEFYDGFGVEEFVKGFFGQSAKIVFGELESDEDYIVTFGKELDGFRGVLIYIEDTKEYACMVKVEP